MEERPVLRRIAAVCASLCVIATGLGAAGFAMGEIAWLPAWSFVTLLYVAIAGGLFADRAWAPALAQGAGLFGAGAFLQSAIALQSTMPAIVVGLALNVALVGLSLFVPDGLSRRQRWSLRFAGLALAPAVLFALAPEQSGAAMVTVLGGAGLVWLGTLGLARGRTWGLLIALLGAPTLAVGVWLAPTMSHFVMRHFLITQPLAPLVLSALGGVAALGALLAVLPFVGPIVRFVFRGAPE